MKTNSGIDPRYYNGKPYGRYSYDYSSVFFVDHANSALKRKLGRFLKKFTDGTPYLMSHEFCEDLKSLGGKDTAKLLEKFRKTTAKNLLGQPSEFSNMNYIGTTKGTFIVGAGFDYGDKEVTQAIVSLLGKSIPEIDIRAYMDSDGRDFLYRFMRGRTLSKTFNFWEASEKALRKAVSLGGPYSWWHDGLPEKVWQCQVDLDTDEDE